MGSAIAAGARVRVVAGGRPRRGEVWAFCDDAGHVVVHRFRRHRPDGWWFQGDANERADRPVGEGALVGRVVGVDDGTGRIRRLGWRSTVASRLRLDLMATMREIRSRF